MFFELLQKKILDEIQQYYDESEWTKKESLS